MKTELNHDDNVSVVHRNYLRTGGAVCMKGHKSPTWNQGIVKWEETKWRYIQQEKIGCFNHGMVTWLQTNWRGRGYEPISYLTTTTWKFVRESLQLHFKQWCFWQKLVILSQMLGGYYTCKIVACSLIQAGVTMQLLSARCWYKIWEASSLWLSYAISNT